MCLISALHQLHLKGNLEININNTQDACQPGLGAYGASREVADAHFEQFSSGGLSLLYDVHAESALG